jgi:hypothetical protein
MNTSLPYIARLEAPPSDRVETTIESLVRGGLPHAFALIDGWEATLVVPTGLAHVWLETPPDVAIASDGPQRSPAGPDNPPMETTPRLRLKREGAVQAVLPLVVGWPFLVASRGGRRLVVTIDSFSLHAGDMRGPGNFGSFIKLSAANAGEAADVFGPAPPSESLYRILPLILRIESRPGLKVLLRYRRLKLLKERLR